MISGTTPFYTNYTWNGWIWFEDRSAGPILGYSLEFGGLPGGSIVSSNASSANITLSLVGISSYHTITTRTLPTPVSVTFNFDQLVEYNGASLHSSECLSQGRERNPFLVGGRVPIPRPARIRWRHQQTGPRGFSLYPLQHRYFGLLCRPTLPHRSLYGTVGNGYHRVGEASRRLLRAKHFSLIVIAHPGWWLKSRTTRSTNQ